jgi:hypothetical protein
MNMLFLKSKYTFNNYKSINEEKNFDRMGRTIKLKIRSREIFILTISLILVFNCRHFFKKAIDDNKLVEDRFEKRKLKQISFDYMIYSISEKDHLNDIKKLSLF